MKKGLFAKITFVIIVFIAAGMIVYPKLISSDSGDLVGGAPTATKRPVRDAVRGQDQMRSSNPLADQTQDQEVGDGESQLSEALKSGKPTMVLFHSDT